MNPQNIILFFLDSLQHHHMMKVISINNQCDTVLVEHADWVKEMDFLESLNTNKLAYRGTLSTDSMRIADTIVYHITCKDVKLNLKEAVMSYHHNRLLHMRCTSFSNNFLYSNVREIYFNPTKGYVVKGFQKLGLFANKEVAYTIQVTTY
jgi:hypothetical protein